MVIFKLPDDTLPVPVTNVVLPPVEEELSPLATIMFVPVLSISLPALSPPLIDIEPPPVSKNNDPATSEVPVAILIGLLLRS